MAAPVAPPGILHDGQVLTSVFADGSEDTREWMPYDKVKYYTNAFILKPGKILLGYKKRGFGKGLYNGFGGKVEPQETSLEAAKRELEEEAGITAPLQKCGVLFFVLEDADHAFHIDIFAAKEYAQNITETDEMRPEWFATSAETSGMRSIPYSEMWQDDIFWMPLLLQDRPFVGRADFNKNQKMIKWWFAEAKSEA